MVTFCIDTTKSDQFYASNLSYSCCVGPQLAIIATQKG